MVKLKKSKLVDLVQELNFERTKEKIGKKELEEIIEDIFIAIEHALSDDYEVTIGEVGILKPVKRNARKGRNPQSGEEITIPERKDVKLKVSKKFKEKLNS